MKTRKTLNIAHRGARSLAPENTLPAAQKAFEIGADLWELDVAMTSDGEIVVLHDDTLERTSNASQVFPERKPWKVETFTLHELRSLDFGSWFVRDDPFQQIMLGSVPEADQKKFYRLPIPTLEEALVFTRDRHWHVNVEIKDLTGKPGDQTIVENVVSLIGSLNLEKSVIISSFNHHYIQRVKSANPGITTAALVEDPSLDPLALLIGLEAQAYNPNWDTLDFDQVQTVISHGFDVFVWTVNNVLAMRKLIDLDVSGIFTDFPQRLIKVLEIYPG